jgi:predicted DNA-binding transcriptional regulator AlpA
MSARIVGTAQTTVWRRELIAQLHGHIETAQMSELPAISGALEELRLRIQLRLSSTDVRPLPENTSDRLLTADEVAERLGQKPRWVYAHRKELPVVDLPGRSLRFSEKRLNSYIQRRLAG